MSNENAADTGNLVSIICRTIGRKELTQALDSIAAQSYSNIELVLVNSAQQDLESFDLSGLNAVRVNPDQQLSRTQAANTGLDAATGQYLMFLDDDDWIASDHIEHLLAILKEQDDCLAAYSSTVKTKQDGTETNKVFDHDFDPLLLMRDNYIPIHAVIFSRQLLDQGCRFDESFDIYEDWDFWLQVAQHTSLIHSKKKTAFYRAGGDSDTTTEDDSQRFQPDHLLGQARATLFNKWKQHWDGNTINQMLGNAMSFDLASKVEEISTRLQEELKKSGYLDARVNELNQRLTEKEAIIHGKEKQLHELQLKLKQRLTEKEAIIHGKEKQLHELQLKLNHIGNRLRNDTKSLRTHVLQLESELNRILSSPSWRAMGPFRRIGRLFAGEQVPEAQELEADDLAREQSEAETVEAETIDKSEESLKKNYDQEAKASLNSFLESDNRLSFPSSDSASLSIILVFFNQVQLSLLCLQSLLQNADVPFELIIVDNCSTDNTDEILQRIDNATILRNDENAGFVKAVNQAAEQAKGKYLLLLNNDAVIHPQTLSSALESIAGDESIGAVGGKIVLTDGSLQEAGSIIWQDGSCLGYGRGDDPSEGPYMFERDVDYCSGAFLLFRRSDFQDLGGFDLDYAPAYYEESDFCIRLQKKGLRIIYNPNAVITHYEFASSGGFSGASTLQKEHQEILCQKHGDWLSKQLASAPGSIQLARRANRFPNVLVIDDRVPHPSLGSGYPRSAHLLNSLDEMDLNLSFYPLQFPVDNWSETYTTLSRTVEVILNKGRHGLQSFLASRKNFYQYIVVSRVHNMAFLREVLAADPSLLVGTKLIYDAEALTAPREILQKKIFQQYVSEEEQEELIHKEMEHASIADTVIAVSDKEAKIYRQHDLNNVCVLGHTIRSSEGENDFSKREGLLFVGALRDEGSPNVDSLLWFTVNVLPLIEKTIPDIKLYIAGDNSASSLASIDKLNVSFLGRVENLDDIYNGCRVFIAPTRFAAGIPHKVHEATARGIPCVSTPLLADQLEWQHEQELLVGASPEEYAAQCVRLYQEQDLWNSIRDAGLKAVAKDCSNEKFQTDLKSLFD